VHLTANVTLPVVENLPDVLTGQPEDTQKRINKAVDDAIDAAVGIPVRLQISNTGVSGIRNLFVQVTIASLGDVDVVDASELRSAAISRWLFAESLLVEPKFYGGGFTPSPELVVESEGPSALANSYPLVLD